MDSKKGGRGRGRGGNKNNGRKPVFATMATRGRGRPQRGGRGGGVGREGDGDKMETSVERLRQNREFSRGNIGTSVLITGFSPNEDKDRVIDFLKSKTSIPTNFISSTKEERGIVAELNTTLQAINVVKLNRIKYKGHPLYIKYDSAGNVSNNLSNKLGPLVESKYNAASQFLDLSNLGGSSFDGVVLDFNRESLVKSLFLAMSIKCPGVVSIDFTNNNISNLKAFRQLETIDLKSIQNICLKGNALASFDELDNMKLFKLREIILTNNPIQLNSTNASIYKTEIQSRFEGIQFIDGEQLEQISFGLGDISSSKVNLPAMVAFFFENGAIKQLAEAFLQKYLGLYDTDRNALIDVYTDTSMFSLSSSGISPNPNKKGKVPSGMYQTVSRNLQSQTALDGKIQLGRVDIIHFMKSLPTTQHQFDDVRIDSFFLSNIQASNVVSVSIHGHFTESNGKIKRSFDRTFILTESGKDSAAALKGWPVVIMNDQIHVRPYNAIPAPAPEEPSATATAPVPQQNDVLAALVAQTRLKQEFAIQLLTVHQGQFDNAMLDFQQAQQQGKITPDMLQ